MSRLCEAVDYLHGQEIVHYDLKPGTSSSCDDGSIRLIDFGMAHELVRGRFAFAGIGASVRDLGLRRARADPPAARAAERRHLRARRDALRDADRAGLRSRATIHSWWRARARLAIRRPRASSARPSPKRPRRSCSAPCAAIRRSATRPPARSRPISTHPALVRVSGLAARLVEVTPGRRRLRWMRFLSLVGVAPVALLIRPVPRAVVVARAKALVHRRRGGLKVRVEAVH